MTPVALKSFRKSAVYFSLILFCMPGFISNTLAQDILFDFDSIAVHSPFPVTQKAGGITAYLSGTGQSYSVQDANTLGFTPTGFSGHIIYPNSINLADLLVKFDKKITDFSIMYACQELGCDDAATMKVTAYLLGNKVGSDTKTASNPGTWPVDTLRCSFTSGFDSVVVHYDKRPPLCQDYGVIYVADNMRVTEYKTTVISNPEPYINRVSIPNPLSVSGILSFSLLQSQHISISIYDITGRLVKNISDSYLIAGDHKMNLDVNEISYKAGTYILNLRGENFSISRKIIIVK